MPIQTLEPLVQRVRHPFAARHVQLLAREVVSPGFVRLTLGGADLAGFFSPGFDDHVKLALPQEGRERPNLPVLVDGIPVVHGPRATLRDYTPLHYDGARHTVQLEFAVHGDGPAAHWARTAPLGQWVGLAGPRGSMLIPTALDWHLLLGDESAMPAIERRLAELPEGTRAIVRVQLADPADGRVWRSAAALDCVFTDGLAQAVESLGLPAGDGFVWGGGEHALMVALRALLLRKGVDAARMRLAAYWKRGAAAHREVFKS